MKKILLSLGMIVFVGSIATGATQAYFNDTDTSTGNTFTAGEIDINLASSATYNGTATTTPQASYADSATSSMFFNFSDIKPGDLVLNDIDMRVDTNPSWACMNVNITGNAENNINEPESTVDTSTSTGELHMDIQMALWNDTVVKNGRFDAGETVAWQGAIGSSTSWHTLADSAVAGVLSGAGTALAGNTTHDLGIATCMGALSTTTTAIDPLGWQCNGASVGNRSQTDSLTADVAFYATQERNNGTFACSSL